MAPLLHKSKGLFEYRVVDGYHRLVVLVDPELHRYLRALVPRGATCNRPRYAPHITVVRGEVPPRLDLWGKLEGQEVEFEYSDFIHHDGTYWWINCFSSTLIDVRLELGLPSSYRLTRPPDGTECFHSTIGNSK